MSGAGSRENEVLSKAAAEEARLLRAKHALNIMSAQHLKQAQEAAAIVRRENATLAGELQLESRQTKHVDAATDDTQQISKSHEVMTRLIEGQRQKLLELERRAAVMTKRHEEQLAAPGSQVIGEANSRIILRQTQALNRQITHAQTLLDKARMGNRELLARIGNLRRQRVSFDSFFKKTARQLTKAKAKAKAAVARSEDVCTKRDAAHEELRALARSADLAKQEFEARWRTAVMESTVRLEQESSTLSSAEPAAPFPRSSSVVAIHGNSKRRFSTTVHSDDDDASDDDLDPTQLMVQLNSMMAHLDMDQPEDVASFMVAEHEDVYSQYKYINTLAEEVRSVEASVASARQEVATKRSQQYKNTRSVSTTLGDLAQQRDTAVAALEECQAAEQALNRALASVKPVILKVLNSDTKLRIGQTFDGDLLPTPDIAATLAAAEDRLLAHLRRFHGMLHNRTPPLPLFTEMEDAGCFAALSAPTLLSPVRTQSRDRLDGLAATAPPAVMRSHLRGLLYRGSPSPLQFVDAEDAFRSHSPPPSLRPPSIGSKTESKASKSSKDRKQRSRGLVTAGGLGPLPPPLPIVNDAGSDDDEDMVRPLTTTAIKQLAHQPLRDIMASR